MNTSRGIVLGHYPPRLSAAELDAIETLLAPKLRRKSVAFADWLAAIAEAERARRETEGSSEPAEAEMPAINAAGLSNRELCDAAIASAIAVRLAGGMPTLEPLLADGHLTLLAWVAARFGGRS